jgi:hypothetical protein
MEPTSPMMVRETPMERPSPRPKMSRFLMNASRPSPVKVAIPPRTKTASAITGTTILRFFAKQHLFAPPLKRCLDIGKLHAFLYRKRLVKATDNCSGAYQLQKRAKHL